MIESALTYARAGLRVHPCRSQDKRPLTRWGTAATTDEAKVRAFWRRWPDALIGMVIPPEVAVIDIDPRNGGEHDPEACEATFTVTTRGGGWHHYYRTDGPIESCMGLLPGVDLCCHPRMVIAPPSPGWDRLNDLELAMLPAAVVTAARHRVTERRAAGSSFEPAEAGSIGEGYRHDYMVRFAGWVIRAFELDDDEPALVEACIEEYARACSPADAPPENITRIARSILSKHRRA